MMAGKNRGPNAIGIELIPEDGSAMRQKLTRALAMVMIASRLAGEATTLEASQAWAVDRGNRANVLVYPVNAVTGAVGTAIKFGGVLSTLSFDDLASDPVRYPSIVWGVRNGSGSELIAFDPFQRIVLSQKTLSASTPIYGLAIDPTTGAMYGAGESGLYRVARDTGATTLVGGNLSIFSALAFDGAGRLYSTRAGTMLVSIDTSTGAVSDVAALSINGLADMAVRPQDGVMFGLGSSNYSLLQIDLSTAAATTVGPSASRGSGLAFTGTPSLPADFDGNGHVDYEDLTHWHAWLGAAGTATREQGDADGDFDVDGNDFLVWQQLLGRELPPVADAVPEPRGAWLATAGIIGALGVGQRRRVRSSGGSCLRRS